MNNDQLLEQLKQINKRLDSTATKADLKDMATKDDIEQLENGQMRLESQMFDLQKGQHAIKEIAQLMNHTVVRNVKNHERRIDNLEEKTHTDNPTKTNLMLCNLI